MGRRTRSAPPYVKFRTCLKCKWTYAQNTGGKHTCPDRPPPEQRVGKAKGWKKGRAKKQAKTK